jgi:hypothetical protein
MTVKLSFVTFFGTALKAVYQVVAQRLSNDLSNRYVLGLAWLDSVTSGKCRLKLSSSVLAVVSAVISYPHIHFMMFIIADFCYQGV